MTHGHFRLLDGFPADTLAFEASGEIDHDAYTRELIPAIEARIAAEGKVKLLYVLGEDFAGYTLGAMVQDAKVGVEHLSKFARVAVVSDAGWIRNGVRMFAPLMPCPVRTFPRAELEAAKAWIQARDEPAAGPGIAASGTLPLAEDMTPEADSMVPPRR
ncbi:MAG: STAS/SEC14 domain-containing protein [Rhodobacter sp.]|uniref:STAS/SEC14 domain-containing protein n=1 Tax=Pararhodobacter sp. TaxID=2127056 RepID=UPI001D625386|nr:STAS/SEC14 domain-containing protein [Pararhodobacter sp.]MCB1344592.1 STAS/SEC14 domain-containing protein [Paracoccaceae bacterium]MCC0072549.1 STAS/SEC14 domain-containing protein [Rhodobacter sp.]HPD94057.1 STAS/SEC14 domain-containing protein [Pararhodobacter sp.]